MKSRTDPAQPPAKSSQQVNVEIDKNMVQKRLPQNAAELYIFYGRFIEPKEQLIYSI